MSTPQPAVAPFPLAPRRPWWTRAWWVLALVPGVLTLAVGVLVLLFPWGIFLLGGGGSVDGFRSFAEPVWATGRVISVIAAVLLVPTVVLATSTFVRRRRALRTVPPSELVPDVVADSARASAGPAARSD